MKNTSVLSFKFKSIIDQFYFDFVKGSGSFLVGVNFPPYILKRENLINFIYASIKPSEFSALVYWRINGLKEDLLYVFNHI
jgi:hypothetical protein